MIAAYSSIQPSGMLSPIQINHKFSNSILGFSTYSKPVKTRNIRKADVYFSQDLNRSGKKGGLRHTLNIIE